MDPDTDPRVIALLSDPGTYGTAGPVELRETHISHVFLAGDYAYKVKKPVKFDFLDFSTLQQRERYCGRELRLNRRLAPDVYLEVLPITLHDGGLRLDGDGEVVEWCLKMRRLPEAEMLDRRVADS
ncbi:MAG: hypothetical protein ACOC46_04885, partial [Pirellulales bacterium]